MICSTCGRDNPAHLTFCQECGQRLGPRIAPPTPPIGLGGDDSGAGYGVTPAAPPVGGPSHLASTIPDAHEPSYAIDSSRSTSRGAGIPGEKQCKVCATVNGANLRYCTSCGSTLDSASGTAAMPAPAHAAPAAARPVTDAAPPPPVAAASPPPAAAISPMPVVDLAPGKAAGDPRTCARCRGVVDPNAQFCKFCGAPLPDAGAPIASRVNGGGAGAGAAKLGATPLPASAQAVRPAAAPAPKPIAPPTPLAAFAPAGVAPIPSASPIGGPSNAYAPPPPMPVAPSSPPPGVPSGSAYGPPPAIPAESPPRPGPSPAAVPIVKGASRGRLVVIAKSGADGPSYPLGDMLDVGRSEGQIIVAEDPYLSPRHVRIAYVNGRLLLRDLGSTNGVFLRLHPARDMMAGRRAPESAGEVAVPLQDQDLILVGQQVLRFDVLREGDSGLGVASEHGTLLFGSPAAPRYARLAQRTVEGVTRDVYYVRKMETVLGRESGDVVFTEDPFLSRRHAAIRFLDRDGAPLPASSKPTAGEMGRFALVDLGSSNGTFLRIRNEVELLAGDHFRVGQQLFRVDIGAGRES